MRYRYDQTKKKLGKIYIRMEKLKIELEELKIMKDEYEHDYFTEQAILKDIEGKKQLDKVWENSKIWVKGELNYMRLIDLYVVGDDEPSKNHWVEWYTNQEKFLSLIHRFEPKK